MSYQPVKFYQTGTFTVGNRLLPPDVRSVQSTQRRTNSLNSGHRACQGCGEALGARYAMDAAMEATDRQLIAANATGCLEVFSTPYPETSWQIPWSPAAGMSGSWGNARPSCLGRSVPAWGDGRLGPSGKSRSGIHEVPGGPGCGLPAPKGPQLGVC